ncbi:MAG: hypothetical protein DMF98_12665 [Acidobacteria bacterium]|nr:MAG: hypothetical protein DMF98_12665 [Acidobacteriota bacterium]
MLATFFATKTRSHEETRGTFFVRASCLRDFVVAFLVAAFLVSPASAFITGQTLYVDGGITATQ